MTEQHHEKYPTGRPRGGLSYLEVVVALFVLMMALIPVFQVFTQGTAGTMLTRDELMAQQYAGEMMAWAHARGFDGLAIEDWREPKEVRAIEESAPIDARFQRWFSVRLKQPLGGLSDWPMEYKITHVEIRWESSGKPQSLVQTGLLFRGRMP